MRVREIEDDFSQNLFGTTGTVEVGGIATGHIQYEGDNDWFAVELTAGETYKIDLLIYSNAGTLSDPYLRGIYDHRLQRGDVIGQRLGFVEHGLTLAERAAKGKLIY